MNVEILGKSTATLYPYVYSIQVLKKSLLHRKCTSRREKLANYDFWLNRSAGRFEVSVNPVSLILIMEGALKRASLFPLDSVRPASRIGSAVNKYARNRSLYNSIIIKNRIF